MPEEVAVVVVAEALATEGAAVVGGEVAAGALAGEAVAGGIAEGVIDFGLPAAFSGLSEALTPEILNGAVTESLGPVAGETLGSGPQTTSLATEAPASKISEAAKELVGTQPATEFGPGTDYSAQTGATPTDVPNPLPDQTVRPKGIIDSALDWAKANPQLAASGVQAAGSALGGAAKGAGDVLAAREKARLDLENKQKMLGIVQQFIQNSSAGGAGVNLGMRPSGAVLRPFQ